MCPHCQSERLVIVEASDVEEAARWSVQGCDGCQSYLKVAETSRSESLGQLLLDDLATWSLDGAALSAGFRPPSESARRLEHGYPGGEDDADD